ncbi:MAG: hypothetical protein ACLFRO_06570 [Desulfobacterales bacterium]
MIVQREEMVGIRANDGVICVACMTDAEWGAVIPKRIVTQQGNMEENMILFCDRCGEPI